MKLPRDLSGRELAQALSQLGYAVTRQTGAHMRLTTNENGEHQAVNAVQNGDIVEIRTNGPASGCMRDAPLAMTLQAAPGYRPVISSSQIYLDGGILLSVEGLDFRDVELLVNPAIPRDAGNEVTPWKNRC